MTALFRLKDECCRFCWASLSIVSLLNCVQIVAAMLVFVCSRRLNLTFWLDERFGVEEVTMQLCVLLNRILSIIARSLTFRGWRCVFLRGATMHVDLGSSHNRLNFALVCRILLLCTLYVSLLGCHFHRLSCGDGMVIDLIKFLNDSLIVDKVLGDVHSILIDCHSERLQD